MVLVVDDDANLRQLLAWMLTDEGFVVDSARNGQEALEWLHRHRDVSCVVLLDLTMPVMDGRTFLRAREADARLSKVPVVISSSETHCDDVAKRYHVNGFLHKPFAPGGLFAALAACD